ncbi:MAG: acetyl/propionyl/methylcrotonyl-CoA carboxylase subunit alpha [Pseudomonadota bacterium]
MFDKILIANRGEIACRVIKTAKRMGVRTVAVYSDADVKALHVSMADEAIHIGAAPSQESYLVSERIIEAALQTGAQAIHPGYGFLSENAEFAELCAKNDLVFIGPPSSAIVAMGSKSAAKSIMQEAEVPLVPGYHGEDQDYALLKASADEMGYPVLLKAVAGGGGKGMRQVWSEPEFQQALDNAKREAMSSFGNDDMLVEKYLTQPRHVEFQVFCDQHGNGVYLFERDCSVQRRHQKVIEEAPAPNMSDELRAAMGEAAVRAAKAIDYQGAGTVEFLLDVDNSYYFMEMNTRLQVEHPVTEFITGQDLVEWQMRVANGEPLPLNQDELSINGHAFEARIYAEDPDNDFLPATGTLQHLVPPAENAHVRVDTGVVQGDEVSPFYDPMIAKLVVWDESRERALARMARALSEYQISGLTTNIQFLYNLATCPPFIQADLDTGFIEKHREAIFHDSQLDVLGYLPMASLYLLLRREQQNQSSSHSDPYSPWAAVNGWRMNQVNMHLGAIIVNGEEYELPTEEFGTGSNRQYRINVAEKTVIASGELEGNRLSAQIDGHMRRAIVVAHDDKFTLFTEHGALDFSLAQPDYGDADDDAGASDFIAPMNGRVIEVLVAAGDQVTEGQALIIMEAMKMQHTVTAPAAGTVQELYCQADDLVDGGSDLLAFTPAEEGTE